MDFKRTTGGHTAFLHGNQSSGGAGDESVQTVWFCPVGKENSRLSEIKLNSAFDNKLKITEFAVNGRCGPAAIAGEAGIAALHGCKSF